MTVTVLVVVLFQGKAGQLAQFSSKTFVFVVLSALAGAASWLAYFRALQLGEASRVAPIDRLSVIFTLVLALVFLHEGLSWGKIGGTLLMVAGAILIAR